MPETPDADDDLPPGAADAFSVLGNELRLEILRALWELDRPASFSDLRHAVGDVDSGKFNYHLGELTGQFVRSMDDGYALEWAGVAIIQAALSGTYTERPSQDRIPVAGPCPRCGAGVELWYDHGIVRVACEADHLLSQYPFPPGGFDDRTGPELARAYDSRTRRLIQLAVDGVCWACNGRRRPTLHRDPALDWPLRVDLECRRCQHAIGIPPGLALVDDPEVTALYRDQGERLRERAHWTLPWCTGDAGTTVRSDPEWEVEVPITVGTERLRVTLDRDLAVTGTHRESIDR